MKKSWLLALIIGVSLAFAGCLGGGGNGVTPEKDEVITGGRGNIEGRIWHAARMDNVFCLTLGDDRHQGWNSAPDVTVKIGDSIAVTDADGQFSLVGIEAGHRLLSLSKPGYKTVELYVDIPENATTTLEKEYRRQFALEGWLTYQGNNQRTGVAEVFVAPPLVTNEYSEFIMPDGDFVPWQPIVVGQRVYLQGMYGHWSYDLLTGEWRNVGDQLGWAAGGVPAVGDKYLYVGSGSSFDGQVVVALDPVSGAPVWKRHIDWKSNGKGCGPEHPMLYEDNLVYVATASGVFALDGDTGKVAWKNVSLGDMLTYAAPATYKGTIYFHTLRNKLYAFNMANGSLEWVVDTPYMGNQGQYAGVSVGNGLIYVGDKAFSPENGELIWDAGIIGDYVSGAAVTEHTIYVCGDALYAIDAQDGTIRWQSQTTAECLYFSPVVANGYVYATHADPLVMQLYVFDCTDGELVEKLEGMDMAVGSPSFVGDTMYHFSMDGLHEFQ